MRTNKKHTEQEVRHILFLPTFHFCKTLNDTNLGILMGILTSLITGLFIKGNYSCEAIWSIIFFIISIVLILLAIKQNQIFNDKCQNIKVNDKKNKFETTSEIIDKFKEEIIYKKIKKIFILCFSFALISFALGVAIYAYDNTHMSSSTTNNVCLCQKYVIEKTVENKQQSKADASKIKGIITPTKENK